MDISVPRSATPRIERRSGKPFSLTSDSTDQARHAEWRRELGRFLSEFHWQAYSTPTFRAPVSFAVAESAARRWLRAIGPEVYAYVAYERGAAGGRTHIHALLGGLLPRRCGPREGVRHLPLAISRAAALWRHGNIKVAPYDPTRGAAWYVAKCPDSGEVIGNLSRHHARVRRRRAHTK